MLVLFDIDATLISTSGAGMRAMLAAGRELLGEGFSAEGVSFAGSLDPIIIAHLFARHGRECSAESAREFRAVYGRHLPATLAHPLTVARSLPGVTALLDALHAHAGVRIGLLTGNFQETGSAKLRACGLDPDRFHLAVWGDESVSSPPCRDDLPGVAIQRCRERFDRHYTGPSVVVIGDTPHDVRCAKAHGCRSLAVATGSFTLDDLRRCEPDSAVPDLADTPAIMRWLLGPRPTEGGLL